MENSINFLGLDLAYILQIFDINFFLTVFIGILFIFLSFVIRGKKESVSQYDTKSEIDKIQKKKAQKVELKKEEPETTLIGKSNNRNVIIKNNTAHVFIAGTTGSGKTVALSNFIKSGINNNYPLVVVDGKGDTGEGSILNIINRLNTEKKVYVINLCNPKESDKYNPFKNTDSTTIKDMLMQMSDWSEPHYKYNTELYIQKVCDLLIDADINVSFNSLVEHLKPDNLVMISKKLVEQNIIDKTEHIKNADFIKEVGKIAYGSFSRFSTIKESKLGTIFDENGIDILTAIREKAIILFILNPLQFQELSPLIGRLIVIDSKKAVSSLFNDVGRKFFIFDEVSSYASLGLLDLVNKSRSANITCILATQSLSDLDTVTSQFKDQIIENCNNYVVLRQNSASGAELWSNTLGTEKTMQPTYHVNKDENTRLGSLKTVREYKYHPDDIKTLKTGEAIFMSKENDFDCTLNINKPF